MENNPDLEATRNALIVNFDSIPEPLQTKPQFVVWKYELDGEDLKKPPFSPKTGKRASVRNNKAWGSMEDARRAYETGEYAGVGYVLTGGVVGIDIDHCIIEGKPNALAQWFLNALPTYTEISPSGRGWRIFVEGYIPGPFRRSGSVEVYDASRYLTLTGHRVIDTPAFLLQDQARLNAVYRKIFKLAYKTQRYEAIETRKKTRAEVSLPDSTVLDKAIRAKNGENFKRHYYGDNSLWESAGSRYQSQSEADITLIYLLLYWTKGDLIQTERLFRLSGLMRPKWDRIIKDNETYGEMTLKKALTRANIPY